MTSLTNPPSSSSGAGRSTVPPAKLSRLESEQVSLGETFQIQGDVELRQQIESSLELIAKQRLLEVEERVEATVQHAEQEAKTILERANAQAKEMLSTTQAQVDAAKEEGFQAGYQEGMIQMGRDVINMLQGMEALIEEAYAAEKLVLKSFESHAVEIVQKVAQKILNRELAENPEAILKMVGHAITSLHLTGRVRLVVSAQLLQNIRSLPGETKQALEQLNRVELVGDPALDWHQIYVIGEDASFDLDPLDQVATVLAPVEKNLVLPRPEKLLEEAPVESTATEPELPDEPNS